MTNKNYSESTIKVGTFFSGIGAPEKAFQKLKIEILEKEDKINELLKIINDEVDEKSEEI